MSFGRVVSIVIGGLILLSARGVASPPAAVTAAAAEDRMAVERFLEAIEKPPVAYQAKRRLEASSVKLNESAWMEVLTNYDPQAGFRYSILAEGGSVRIRRRVLKSVLEGELENSAPEQWTRGNLSAANYEFIFGGRTGDGMLRMDLNPRRRDARLVNGAALLTVTSGNLVRVQGRLSKSPSIWVRWAEITRSYTPIAGSIMPVAIESTADVRIAGLSKFVMTYEYLTVDGKAVSVAPGM